MNSHVAVVASLALAIFLSPETLVIGLIVAADKKAPRLSALGFALGGVAGIAFATGVGLWAAQASGTGTHHVHHGWPAFAVRLAIAGALLGIGGYRAVNVLRDKPITDPSVPEDKPSRMRTALARLVPALDPASELPVRQRVARAGLAGFVMCGLHPKVFPIAIAAGHQILQITQPGQRALSAVLFAVIAVTPALLPAVIDVVNPGATVRIREGYERIMKIHGRWITATLLLAAGSYFGYEAWHDMPGR